MLAILVGLAMLATPIVIIVKLSGRRFGGDITGPQGREVNYEDPYPGWWSFFDSSTPAQPAPPRQTGPIGAPDIEFIKAPPRD